MDILASEQVQFDWGIVRCTVVVVVLLLLALVARWWQNRD